MKRSIALFIFYFALAFCNAQVIKDTTRVNIASVHEDSSILSQTLLYIDSSSSLSPAEALQKTFWPLKKLKSRRGIPPDMIGFTYFLKIPVSNESEKEQSVYLYPGSYFSKTELYKSGQELLEPEDADSISGYRKLTLAPGEHSFVLFQLKPLKNEFNSIIPLVINKDYVNDYKEMVLGTKTEVQIIGLILSGVLLMMILFMITNFLIDKKREFLYNALYSLCMFLLILLNSSVARKTTAFTNFYYSYFDFFLLVAGTIFYIAFTRQFLNTKADHRQLDKVLKRSEYFILLLLCVYTYLNFFTDTYLPQFYLENIMKFLILAIGIAFIYLAFKQRNKLLNYIAWGNAMLVFFSAISLGILLDGVKPASIFSSALFWYYVGIVLELIFFLLGITYKNRSELIRRTKEQEAMKLEAEKKEFETQLAIIKAQQEERNRISADMHDDLGAGMTTIRLYSELAKNKLNDNPIPEIDKISSSANELLNKMNAIIWSMTSSNDSLGNMVAYIRSYALEYFENTGINCRISIPENLPNIEVIGEIRRNVFLVVKEALNNILKHSKATEVNIVLERVPDGLTLHIQDNGVGIDLNALRQFGNGLKNMKKRMQDINVEFNIEKKNGTLVTLHRKIMAF
ncbi:MAG TPA: 7TM diverse intracellular signaling domain-containing protein [Ferruginibacter sp.]|nr:7TM diverse intracellular signaling domain-containing protein [Ferruginibacter sp.]